MPDNYLSLLGSDVPWEPITFDGRDGIRLDYTEMYEAPAMNFQLLKQVSDHFGTEQIDVDDISESGCDTCDYGSRYGYEIYVYAITRNDPRSPTEAN